MNKEEFKKLVDRSLTKLYAKFTKVNKTNYIVEIYINMMNHQLAYYKKKLDDYLFYGEITQDVYDELKLYLKKEKNVYFSRYKKYIEVKGG